MNWSDVRAGFQQTAAAAQALGWATVVADCNKGIADVQTLLPAVGVPLLKDIVDTAAWRAPGQYNHSTIVAGVPYVGDLPTPSGVINSIVSGWSGAAFDYAARTMHIVVAGGHADSWNNESYAYPVGAGWIKTRAQTPFPPDAPTPGYAPVNGFSRDGLPTRGDGFYIPAGATGAREVFPSVGGCEVYFDGAPCSRHTYGGTVWLPVQQRVLLLSGSCWGGFGDAYVGWFDPESGQWTRKANLPYGPGTGFTTAYDALRGLVYWECGLGGMGQVYKYDPATDTHTRMGPAAGSPLNSSVGGNHTVLCCDGAATYLYAFQNASWTTAPAATVARMKLGQASAQPWQLVPIAGDLTGMFGDGAGVDYDPERNAFVFWSARDPGSVSILSLDSFGVTRQLLATLPDSSLTHPGVWGRFRRYAPNQYVLFTNPAIAPYLLTLT